MNNQAKHTPGPWNAVNGGPYVKQSGSDPNGSCGDSVIAITSNTASRVRFAAEVGSLEDKANAWLIASAPELLDACRALEEAMAEVPCISNKQEAARVQARTAIRKAERGPQ